MRIITIENIIRRLVLEQQKRLSSGLVFTHREVSLINELQNWRNHKREEVIEALTELGTSPSTPQCELCGREFDRVVRLSSDNYDSGVDVCLDCLKKAQEMLK